MLFSMAMGFLELRDKEEQRLSHGYGGRPGCFQFGMPAVPRSFRATDSVVLACL